MFKRIKLGLAVVTVALGTLGMAGTTAGAITPKLAFKNVVYDNVLSNNMSKLTVYHLKSTKKSAYMWNDTHTKKLHNLKNYRTYSWFRDATGTLGKSKWLKVRNFPGTKSGWVWSGYLANGYNSKGYQVIRNRFGVPQYAGGTWHYASRTKNAYVWNWSHTKVLANLKNYTNYNLGRSHSILVRHNGKNTWYSGILMDTPKGLISGYVAQSLLTEGKTTYHAKTDVVYPDDFSTTAEYLDYIKNNNNQKLTRAIVALFPNTPVDLGMSQLAAHNYYNRLFRGDDDDGDDQIDNPTYTDIVPFRQVTKYLLNHRTASNATKIAGVKKLLDEAGYPQSKRNQLTDYKLGIYVINNVVDPVDKSHTGKMAWYGLAIGKAE